MHLSLSVAKNCFNPYDTYGVICVRCNGCGRFDPKTKYESQLKILKNHLQNEYEFNDWYKDWEDIQRKNKADNIEYLKKLIAEVEEKIKHTIYST